MSLAQLSPISFWHSSPQLAHSFPLSLTGKRAIQRWEEGGHGQRRCPWEEAVPPQGQLPGQVREEQTQRGSLGTRRWKQWQVGLQHTHGQPRGGMDWARKGLQRRAGQDRHLRSSAKTARCPPQQLIHRSVTALGCHTCPPVKPLERAHFSDGTSSSSEASWCPPHRPAPCPTASPGPSRSSVLQDIIPAYFNK